MTNEEYAKEEKAKARKRLVRWSGAWTVVVGLLWFVWYLKNGSIPFFGEGFGFDEMISIKISRVWVDMFFTPVLVVIFRFYFNRQGHRMENSNIEDRVALESFFTVVVCLIVSFALSIPVGVVLFVFIALVSYVLAHVIMLGRKILLMLWEAFGDLLDWLNAAPSRHEKEVLRLKANGASALSAPVND